MIVVTDSTVLIGLAKLGKLTLLKEIFSKVSIPKEVFKEVVERGKVVKDNTQVSFLMGSLERGEAEVLALARELEADLISVRQNRS